MVVMNPKTFFFLAPDGGAQLLGASHIRVMLLEVSCAFKWGGEKKPAGLGKACPGLFLPCPPSPFPPPQASIGPREDTGREGQSSILFVVSGQWATSP